MIGTYFANIHTPNARTGQTVVTYDKGGDWIPLTPPPQFLYCQPVSSRECMSCDSLSLSVGVFCYSLSGTSGCD